MYTENECLHMYYICNIVFVVVCFSLNVCELTCTYIIGLQNVVML